MKLIKNLEEKYKEYGEISFGNCSIDVRCLVEPEKYITKEMIMDEQNMEKKRILLLFYGRKPGSAPFQSESRTEEAYAYMRDKRHVPQDYDSLWGVPKFLHDTNAKAYAKDEYGELLELDLSSDGNTEKHYWLRVVNHTRQPENEWVNKVETQSLGLEDGRKVYYLPCEDVKWETPKAAVAHTFKMTEEELDNMDFRS